MQNILLRIFAINSERHSVLEKPLKINFFKNIIKIYSFFNKISKGSVKKLKVHLRKFPYYTSYPNHHKSCALAFPKRTNSEAKFQVLI